MAIARAEGVAYSVFHPGWVVAGIAVGLGLQLLAGFLSLGLLGGLLGYVVMGILIGVASPGNTIVEPGVAAFVMAAGSYVIGNLVLSVFIVGLVPTVAYGLVGLALGVAGGWVGEKL